MQSAVKLPDQVLVLQKLVLEQQHMIETLKEQLLLMKRRQFGPRNEAVNVDQFGLFACAHDASTVIAVSEQDSDSGSGELPAPKVLAPRKQAIRILKDLPREIRVVDISDADKVCSCCGGALH